MRIRRPNRQSGERGQNGQVLIFVALCLAVFLAAIVGFSTDFARAHFRRQRAQTAADAACIAGAMDLLLAAEG